MYRVQIAYETAKSRHPFQTAQIARQVSVSGYMVRGKPISTIPISMFSFYYDCTVKLHSFNGKQFMEMVASGEMQRQQDAERKWEETASIAEKVARKAERTTAFLIATPPDSNREFSARLSLGSGADLPEEIRTQIRDAVEEGEQERVRFAALTPKQQQAELEEHLSELRKSPGFFAVGMRRKHG